MYYLTQKAQQCGTCGTKSMRFRRFVPTPKGVLCRQTQGADRVGLWVCLDCYREMFPASAVKMVPIAQPKPPTTFYATVSKIGSMTYIVLDGESKPNVGTRVRISVLNPHRL